MSWGFSFALSAPSFLCVISLVQRLCIGDQEKGTDLFFYSKTRRGVRIRVRKINLSPFLVLFCLFFVYAQDVADLMRSEGVPASAFGNRNVADLTRYTSSGTPVVVRIADRTGGSDFSHFVVVDGVTTRNGVAVVAIRDPHGAQYFSPVATFEKSFTGEVVVPRSALK